MATQQQFEWVQPIGGQKIVWRPLKVGDHIDLEANYGRSDTAHLKRFATIAARLVSVDGKAKHEFSGDLANLRDWEDYDLMAFNDEIETRELARAVALAPQRPGGVVMTLQQAVDKAQAATIELSQALTVVLERTKEAEQKLGPLK